MLLLKDCKSISTTLDVEAGTEYKDYTLVSKTMEDEENKLQEERWKEEEKGNANEPKEEPLLNDTQFSKLDELLTQTQLYSEFLLEKMDDITKVFLP